MAKFPKTLLLVSSVKIQYARDDEGPHSCINHNKNIDNDLYCSSNEFPNHLALLTMICLTTVGIEPTIFGMLAQCSKDLTAGSIGSALD